MEDPPTRNVDGDMGELCDRYKVLDLLGQGSFGTVATGVDRKTGKRLAIKHIHPMAHTPCRARHILREVTIMRILQHHPNVRWKQLLLMLCLQGMVFVLCWLSVRDAPSLVHVRSREHSSSRVVTNKRSRATRTVRAVQQEYLIQRLGSWSSLRLQQYQVSYLVHIEVSHAVCTR